MNYAAEERAYKVLDKAQKTKPISAPLYPTEEKVLKQIRAEHPELAEKIKEKNEKLNVHLKQVKVLSETVKLPPPSTSNEIVHETDHSKLPQQRYLSYSNDEFGYPEISEDKVPPGKLSFRQAMEIFQQIRDDTDTSKAESVAADKKLSAQETRTMLQYFRPFLYVRDEMPRRPIEITDCEEDKIKKTKLNDHFETLYDFKVAQSGRAFAFREQYKAQLEKLNYEMKKEKLEKQKQDLNEKNEAKNSS